MGTRLRPLTNSIPKALVPAAGRPFLEWKLEQLKANGVDNVVLCVGYLGSMIKSHFGDGSGFGLNIGYSEDGKELLGPIGAVKNCEHLLHQGFFVTYGDNYLRLDYAEMMARLSESGKLGVMAVYHNKGAHGTSDVEVTNGFVTAFKKGTKNKFEWINFGIYALRKEALSLVPAGRPCDEQEFFEQLIRKEQLLAYEATERFYEIGSIEALREFESFISKEEKRQR